MIVTKLGKATFHAKKHLKSAVDSMKLMTAAVSKSPIGKGLKTTDKAIGKTLYAGGKGFKNLQSKVKNTGTYKDIRKITKKIPITAGEGAAAFTFGVGIGTLGRQGYDKVTGYERKRVKKNRKV